MIALYRASISCPKGSRYIEALGLNIYPMGGAETGETEEKRR